MKVLQFFEEISKIPRGSGNEQGISDYLIQWGKERGLEARQDKALNVVIYKPGSKGLENSPPLILQSHMDIVCEKNADTVHDFLTDPITLRQEGDFLYANGTTLGADNGLGMALSMAVLDSSDMAHPPLEVIFTAEEETTMKGISQLDASWLKARRMINMDSGNDTTFCVGCAGGGRLLFAVPVKREALPAGMICRTLIVRGLLGGHSGGEINMGKANSIRVLSRALNALEDARIISVKAGLKANAIPREADAVIAVADIAKAEQVLAELQTTLRNEHRTTDPNITLALMPAEEKAEVFSKCSQEKLIAAMLLIPYGVIHMSYDIPGLVETSNNIGVMETDESCVTIECALRSSVPSRRNLVCQQIDALAKGLGCTVEFGNAYPAWTYNPDSPLLAKAIDVFRQVNNAEPNIRAIHAGLECGFMMEKIPDMDIISYCGQVFDGHTPNEHMSLSSVERVWNYTIALLEQL